MTAKKCRDRSPRRYHCTNCGCPHRSYLTPRQAERVVELSRAGMTCAALGRRFGVNREVIAKLLRVPGEYRNKFRWTPLATPTGGQER